MSTPRRNDPCPCGSGRRFKNCCGAAARASAPAIPAAAPPSPQVLMAMIQGGQAAQAGRQLEGYLAANPGDANARALMALACQAQGDLAAALVHQEVAVRLVPGLAEWQLNLGSLYRENGRPTEAEVAYRQAAALKPEMMEAYFNLSGLLEETGRMAEAVAASRQALALRMDYVPAWLSLARLAFRLNDFSGAYQAAQRALSLAPEDADVMSSLANALRGLGQVDEAQAFFERAIACRSDLDSAHYGLGNLYYGQQRLAEAADCYRRALAANPQHRESLVNLGNVLFQTGHHTAAVEHYRQALALDPNQVEALTNLGLVLQELKDLPGAIAHMARAAELAPDRFEAWNNLGTARMNQRDFGEAARCFARALDLSPKHTDTLANMTFALAGYGADREAVAFGRQALEASGDAKVHSNLLFIMNFAPSVSAAELYAEHRRWAAQHASGVPRMALSPAEGPRLRVGFLSPDLCDHPVSFFLLPLLEHIDRQRFELFCYANNPIEDRVSERIKALADHWRNIAFESDEAVAQAIAADGVQLLVDLAGHTAGNRLKVLARKPAPVIATWLGYLNTTGLDTVDYRITDAVADPEGAEAFHSERLMRLPHSQWCYRPPAQAPEVGPLPALAGGGITFASLNQLGKLSPELTALWARILLALPTARLAIMIESAAGVPEKLARPLIDAGVWDRVLPQSRLPYADYLALHNQVDIALDSHPYSGGTTTCHALWMGVPVATLVGETSPSRSSASLLATLGLNEWIAASGDEYVARTVGQARDVEGLAHLRGDLRRRMAASPLCDAPGFARDMERAWLAMWRQGRVE